MINRIKKKVEFFLNTEARGNFTPQSFEEALHDAIQGRNEEYFYDLNRLIVRENRAMITGGIANITDKYSEKILHYLEETSPIPVVNKRITLPDDWRYLDVSEFSDGSMIEFCKDKREFNILKTEATKQYPVCMLAGNVLSIAPATDTDTVTLSYLRQVKYPKWTYTTIDDVELFNPDAADFQDADIHPSEENEMVRRVLMAFGVNLSQTDILNFTVNEERTDNQQENQT